MLRRRFPVILQMSAAECGAACLAMILRHWGDRTPLAECRERVGGGQTGVTALMIADAARSLRLEVKPYRLAPHQLALIQPPAILHWNGDHFVVLERWSPQRVDIIDPAVGRCRLDMDEVAAHFGGITLMFTPGPTLRTRLAAQPEAEPAPAWRKYVRHLLHIPGARAMLAQILLASLLLQALGLLLPFLTQFIVDRVLPSGQATVMTILGVGLALLLLAQVVMGYLRTTLAIILQTRLDAHLMHGFFEHLLALPLRFFQERTSGDLLLRLESNATIREIFTTHIITTILDGMLVVVYLGILFGLAPMFGLIVLIVALFQIGLLSGVAKTMHQLTQRNLVAQAEEQSYLVEALQGVETLKAGGAEARVFDRWSRLFFAALRISLQRNQIAALVETALRAVSSKTPLILLWGGVYAVLSGRLSLGAMLALTVLASSCLAPLASLASSIQQIQLVKAHLDRLSDVMEAAPEQTAQAGTTNGRLSGQIELRDVSFRYASGQPLVLRDLSFAIRPGQKVALVGPSGAGKSTLARLLLGLYAPTSGEIRFDGVWAAQMDYRWLRSQLGVVLQNVFLLSGSLRENIAFYVPDLPMEQVIQAAKLAAIHDEIVQLPMGYATRVAEGGSALSGGQRQRLALARALANRPSILLLDEATSHMDVPTEQLVDSNLGGLGCTRIVIAHRLSTVRTADLILVLVRGEIVEQGTHEELVALGSVYTALMQSREEIDSLHFAGKD